MERSGSLEYMSSKGRRLMEATYDDDDNDDNDDNDLSISQK